jgi:hypothetical protein
MTPRVLVLVVCMLLAGCDTFGLGYVNKLRHPVRIVEHGSLVAQPFTLQPGAVKEVGFGHVAESIDILRQDGQVLQHYRIRDLPRVGRGRAAEYVVIAPSRVVIEQKEHLGDYQ